TARQGEIATMAARNKCLGGITNPTSERGPVQFDVRVGTPMNPFRGWRDEPVSRAETERVTGRSKGACVIMKLQRSSANLRISGTQPNEQIAGRSPPTDPRVSTYSLARAIEEVGAAMSFPRDAEIYRESSPASYLYKVVSGTVRTFKALSNGRRQIRAFY